MEKPSRISINDSNDVSRGAKHSSDDSQLAESVGSDDPPPIPSAGSSSVINDDFKDGARIHNLNRTSSETEEKGSITLQNCHESAHTLPSEHVIHVLNTNADHGLSLHLVTDRQQKFGPNKLETSGGVAWSSILVRQVSNSLTIVLTIAMILSYATLDFIEGGVISAVIVFNIIVGFFQDYRAEQTIQSLLALAAPSCRVIRDGGKLCTIKADDATIGDIVQLTVGDVVCADIRLIATVNFASDEALLTGEAKPCNKHAHDLSDLDAPLGDRHNMAYASTMVSRGRAVGVIVAVGMRTEVGKIALLLRDKRDVAGKTVSSKRLTKVVLSLKNALGLVGTPLQVKLSYFGLLLFALAVLLAVIVFSAASWDIDDETLIYGICVAVAVIPESLIAVVTIVMAVGSQTMAKGNVIVRKMGALEAIGGVTDVCSDKTGTLTQGKMLARKAWLPDGRVVTVANEATPFDPTKGDLLLQGETITRESILTHPHLDALFRTAGLCNIAKLEPPKIPSAPGAIWSAIGEPTEIALQVFAARLGCDRKASEQHLSLMLAVEHSFDSSVKRMSVVFHTKQSPRRTLCYTKGATEVLLPLLADQDEDRLRMINAEAEAMALEGLRVLCLAFRSIPEHELDNLDDRASVEHDLVFAGLVGLYGPPRIESAGAIRQCQAAGITVHMLTGDHLSTATTIAKEIGILSPRIAGYSSQSAIMNAAVFDRMTDMELDNLDQLPFVLARCTPSTKVRMLHALHRRGKYCVMTGDGVNDSPALKGADVGVAMGLNGSDVSKEAADMVLTDDNFASIVTAVREGRRLFDNIQKFLLHLLVSNIAQVILLLIGLAFKDADGVSIFPLSPLEILCANLVTSSFLAIGLGLEKPSMDVMSRQPHDLKVGVFTKELIVDKFIYGTFMGCLCLASYTIVLFGVGNRELGVDCNHNWNKSCNTVYRARGTAYSILTVLLSAMAWEAKHLTRSLFNMYPEQGGGVFSVLSTVRNNKFLFWAVIVGMLTPFATIYIPVVNIVVFRHESLKWEWGLVAGSLVSFVALVESWKAIKRRMRRGKSTSLDNSSKA